MTVWTSIRSWRNIRRSLRLLEQIAAATDRQAAALERIANKIDPPVAADPDPIDLRARTGVSYHPDEEAAKIESYIAKCFADTRRLPTDEEICRYLDGEDVRLGSTPS